MPRPGSLVQASGGSVAERRGTGWAAFEGFEATARSGEAQADLRHWRRPLIVGEAQAAARLADA